MHQLKANRIFHTERLFIHVQRNSNRHKEVIQQTWPATQDENFSGGYESGSDKALSQEHSELDSEILRDNQAIFHMAERERERERKY